jgi:hypothetical protein
VPTTQAQKGDTGNATIMLLGDLCTHYEILKRGYLSKDRKEVLGKSLRGSEA